MSVRPHSRAIDPAYAEKFAALAGVGVELQSIAAHAEVSVSTLRRVRIGRAVVRAVARSIELSVDILHTKHIAAGEEPTPGASARTDPSVCAPAVRPRASSG